MIQTTEQINAIIETDLDEVTSKMLRDLIKEHRTNVGKRQQNLWMRYTMQDVPIYNREPAAYEKVDRRTANDFYGDIVDTKVGYMGNEVTVSLDRGEYTQGGALNEDLFTVDRDALRGFALENAAEDQNSEMVRDAAAVGVGYRLLFSVDNQVRMQALAPWEVIYIYDQSIDEPIVAIRYYTITQKEFGHANEQVKKLTAVEWYDESSVRYYIDDGELNFTRDTARAEGGEEPHLFNGVPVIPFPNNREMTAEPEKVTDLMDAYDAIISSTTSEIEQLRMAYMFVKGSGMQVDSELVEQLEQTGIFPLDENGDVGFINKQLADAPVHNLLAEIRRNIYQFAKSIDMSKNFGGDMRVIGWQVALLNLENSSKITERKFTRALRHQYKLITEYWRQFGGADIDPMTLEFTFTRNFPRDIRAEAETLQLLLSTVSTKTAFEQMSFIDDAEAEIERVAEETNPFRGDNGDAGPTDEQSPDREGASED